MAGTDYSKIEQKLRHSFDNMRYDLAVLRKAVQKEAEEREALARQMSGLPLGKEFSGFMDNAKKRDERRAFDIEKLQERIKGIGDDFFERIKALRKELAASLADFAGRTPSKRELEKEFSGQDEQIARLKSAIEKRESLKDEIRSIGQLKGRIEEIDAAGKERIDRVSSSVEKELEGIDRDISELRKGAESIQMSLKGYASRAELGSRAAVLDKHIAGLGNELGSVKGRLDKLGGGMPKADLAELARESQKAAEDIRRIGLALKDIPQGKSIKKDIDDLRQSCVTAESWDETNKGHRSELARLSQELKDAKAVVKELDEGTVAADYFDQEMQAVEAEILDLKGDIEKRLKGKLDSGVFEKFAEEQRKAVANIQNRKDDKQISALAAKLNELKAAVGLADDAKISERLGQLENGTEALHKEMSRVKEQNEGTVAADYFDKEIEAIENEISELKNNVELGLKAKLDVQVFDKFIDKYSRDRGGAVEKQVEVLSSKLRDLQKGLESKDYSEITERLGDLENRFKDVSKEMSALPELGRAVESAKPRIEGNSKQIAEIQKSISSMESGFVSQETLNAELNTIDSELKDMKEMLEEEADKSSAGAKNARAETAERFDALAADLSRVKDELAGMPTKKVLSFLSDDIGVIKDNYAKKVILKKGIAGIDKRLKQQNEQLRSLENAAKTAQDHSRDIEKIRKQVSDLEDHAATTAALDQEVRILDAEINDVKLGIEKIEEGIAEVNSIREKTEKLLSSDFVDNQKFLELKDAVEVLEANTVKEVRLRNAVAGLRSGLDSQRAMIADADSRIEKIAEAGVLRPELAERISKLTAETDKRIIRMLREKNNLLVSRDELAKQVDGIDAEIAEIKEAVERIDDDKISKSKIDSLVARLKSDIQAKSEHAIKVIDVRLAELDRAKEEIPATRDDISEMRDSITLISENSVNKAEFERKLKDLRKTVDEKLDYFFDIKSFIEKVKEETVSKAEHKKQIQAVVDALNKTTRQVSKSKDELAAFEGQYVTAEYFDQQMESMDGDIAELKAGMDEKAGKNAVTRVEFGKEIARLNGKIGELQMALDRTEKVNVVHKAELQKKKSAPFKKG
ncbi:MAG: hypothetical protein ABH879_02840 [archaeon]